MKNDDLEFSISQYLDKVLAPIDRDALERRVAEDAAARVMLDEYRRLDAALRSMPMPVVRWDALAASISSTIDAAQEEHEEQVARSYRMPAWFRLSVMPMALAASLFVVAGVGIQIYRSQPSHAGSIAQGLKPTADPIVAVSSPTISVDLQADKITGPVVAQVAIGPGPAAAGKPIAGEYANDPASIPSNVSIASEVIPAHDAAPLASYDME